MSKTFKSRYFAKKEMATNSFYHGDEIIVKVDGGFVIMDYSEFFIWKNQK